MVRGGQLRPGPAAQFGAVMILLKLEDDQARTVLTVLNSEWEALDRHRKTLPYPDDQPVLEAQRMLEPIMQVLRMALK